MPRASNRLPMVPKLSSAARIPLPGATSSCAVSSSFRTSMSDLLSPNLTTEAPNRSPGPLIIALRKALLPSGPYELTILRHTLLLGLLRPLLAAPAVFLLPHPAGLFLRPAIPVGVAHNDLLANVSLSDPVYPHTSALNITRHGFPAPN